MKLKLSRKYISKHLFQIKRSSGNASTLATSCDYWHELTYISVLNFEKRLILK